MDTSNITLIGPGAIGSALAAGLIEAGHQPALVARTTFDRLRVEWPTGAIDAAATCVTDPSELGPADVVIVATKATQNDATREFMRASIRPGSIVVVAQNGIDHLDRLPDAVDSGAVVLPAIPMLPAERLGPGHVVVGQPSKLIVPSGPAANVVASIFDGSFIEIDATDDWTTAAWRKLMMNASSGGVCVLARGTSEMFRDSGAQRLLLDVMEEVAVVGRAEGAVLADDLPARMLRSQVDRAGGHTTSIVLDRLAGAPTEWRERNDIVVSRAELHGIDVPVNRAIATLMRLGEPDR